jgi:predicted nucleic acid-binding protein
MTTVLDATALIDLFVDGPAANDVQAILERETCVVTSVNLAEVAYTMAREQEVSVEEIRRLAETRIAGVITALHVTEDDAWRAADLRNRYYHARRSALSLADCVLLAAAGEDDTIVTADHALARAARAEGIQVVGLPDARGRRP